MSTINVARRRFLKKTSLLSGAAGVSATPFALNLAALSTAAAATADYKAIVCLYMQGGNDSANMVLRTDAANFASYTSIRKQLPDPIALLAPGVPAVTSQPRYSPAGMGGVRPIVPKFTVNPENKPYTYAVHPLMPDVQDLFTKGRLAVLANVGPLVVPVTRAQYSAGSQPLPQALGSHIDQTAAWQALGPAGTRVGWGGRLGDMVAGANSSAMFTTITPGSTNVFLAGNDTSQYQVSADGAIPISYLNGGLFGSYAASQQMKSLYVNDAQGELEAAYIEGLSRSVAAQSIFQTAYAGSNVAAPSMYLRPSTGLMEANPTAQQLQTVARVIGARSALGAKRQVFFVNLLGFDTHDAQNIAHADLMAAVSHALGYFNTTIANLGGVDMSANITLFTASDFGRSLTSNGDGTDHGWGGHQLVMGGAVNGGEIYGRFPAFNLNGDNPDLANNSFLPSTSVDTIGATLGKWFGVSDANLNLVFPNLKNFNVRDWGFLKTS